MYFKCVTKSLERKLSSTLLTILRIDLKFYQWSEEDRRGDLLSMMEMMSVQRRDGKEPRASK